MSTLSRFSPFRQLYQAATAGWLHRREIDLRQWRAPALSGLTAAAVLVMLRLLGVLEPLELKTFDVMQRLRPVEPVDRRIVVVSVSESDLNWLDTPLISDAILAQVIERIKVQEPRLIGLDFYRNVPVEPGHALLQSVMAETPNLIGIEKVILDEGQSRQDAALPGNEILANSDRVAASDVIVDRDGRVRRALLFPATTGPRVLEGLGARLALDYLGAEGLYPDPEIQHELRIAGERIAPVELYSGGYVRLHSGGYQMLFNPRRTEMPVALISVRDLLTGNVASDLKSDRIVVIGNAAPSSADLFYSNHSNSQFRDAPVTYGVELHAETASQIISQVLDQRPALYSLAEGWEILLIAAFAVGGAGLQTELEGKKRNLLLGGILLGAPVVSYVSFFAMGLWLPLVPCLGVLGLASLLMLFNRSNQFKVLAEKDGLTRLDNRRRFDESLQREWMTGLRSRQPLSLILCDVDHFKCYNDTYGHAQGDDCLRQVAQVIQTVTAHGSGLAARYGGEEFVVLMPNRTTEEALAQANQIRERLVALQLPHCASQTEAYVTLSLGVATLIPDMKLPMGDLVEQADVALYASKQAGRNQAQIYQPAQDSDAEDLPRAA